MIQHFRHECGLTTQRLPNINRIPLKYEENTHLLYGKTIRKAHVSKLESQAELSSIIHNKELLDIFDFVSIFVIFGNERNYNKAWQFSLAFAFT
jgi:hypothetical protein